MNRQLRIILTVSVSVVLLAAGGFFVIQRATAQGEQPASYNLPQRWEYSVKFVCGLSNDPGNPPAEPDVKAGSYATKINIHNPNAQTVSILKKVVLANPEDSKTLIPPTKRFQDRLESDWAMSVNCAEIVRLLSKSKIPPGPNATFIEGYLVIDSISPAGGGLPQLDVDAVYTIAQPSAGAVSGVDGIAVTHINGRVLPAGTWPF